MPDTVELTTDKNTWEILTPLLDKLDATVAKRFPEEAIYQDYLNAAHVQTQNAEDDLHKAKQAYDAVVDLEIAYNDHEKAIQLETDRLAEKGEAQLLLNSRKQDYEKAKLVLEQAGGKDTKLKQKVIEAKQKYDTQEIVLASATEALTEAEQYKKDKKTNLLQTRKALADPIAQSGDEDIAAIRTVMVTEIGAIQSLKMQLSELQEGKKKSLSVKQSQERTYQIKVNNLAKAYAKKRERLAKAIRDVRVTQGKDYLGLSSAMDDLAKKAPGLYGQTVADFKLACDSARHQAEIGAVKDKLSKGFREALANPGDSKSATIEFDAGVAAGILGADIKAVYTLGLTVRAEKDSQNRYVATFENTNKLTVSAKAGMTLSESQKAGVKGKVQGALGIGKSHIYVTEDDFIEQESNTVMAAIMAGNGGKKNRDFVTESAKLLTKANEAHGQLERNLHLLEALPEKKKLALQRQSQGQRIDMWTKSGSLDASLSSGFGVNDYGVGVALGDGIKAVSKTMYKKIAFLDDIEAEPVLQKIHGLKTPKSFGFYSFSNDGAEPVYVSDTTAMNELDRIEKHLVQLKSDPNDEQNVLKNNQLSADKQLNINEYQRQLSASLGMLQQEYNAYTELANYIDHGYDSKDAKDRLSELAKRRGASNNAEYVKAMSIQFARLRGLYERCFDSVDDIPTEAATLNNSFADDLKIPRMKIKKSAADKAFGVNAQTDSTKVTSFGGFFEIGSVNKWDESTNSTKATGKLKVAVSYSLKEAPDFPNDENIKLKFNLDLGVKGDSYVADLFELPRIKALFGDSALDVRDEMKKVMRNMANGSVEFNYTKRHDNWVVKNAKGYAENDLTIGGQMSIGGDIKAVVGMRLKSSSKQVKNIYFGTHTLHAMPDVFRAKHYYTKNAATQKEQDTTWDDFREKTDLLGKMAERLIAEKKVDNQDDDADKKVKVRMLNDLRQWLGELDGDEKNPESKQAADTFRKAFNNGKADKQTVEKALSELIRAKVARDDQVIADTFIKRRKLNTQDVNQYAAEQLANAMDSINEDYKNELQDGTTQEAITDVESLVAKSKALYKQHANDKVLRDKYYKLLKRAHALEYATKRLNELTRYGDYEDTNQAIAILGSEMKTLLNSDSVYLNDRVDGKLIISKKGAIEIQAVIRKGQSTTISEAEINTLVQNKFGGIKQHKIQMIDNLGRQKKWRKTDYSPSDEKLFQKQQSSKKHRLRSMRTRKNLLGSKNGNIAEALAKVMQDRFKRRQKKQQADQNRRKSSVV